MNNLEKASPPSASKDATPLMRQYEQIKAAHPGEILMFRLGDFYEMFGEDARAAAPVLEVALTQRQGTPMCGIPFHAMERYMAKLLKKGMRVAIAEQLEDPAAAKGIVKREVVRTISAGTIIEERLLKDRANNFLLAVAFDAQGTPQEGHAPAPDTQAGLAALDISTGEFTVFQIATGAEATNLAGEIARIGPAEVLVSHKFLPWLTAFNDVPHHTFTERELGAACAKPHPHLQGQPWTELPLAVEAAQMVTSYLEKMNPSFLQSLQRPRLSLSSETMSLDKETIENLELVTNSYDGTQSKTLLNYLDRTVTSMGARLLKQWVVRPLVRLDAIQDRLRMVEFLVQAPALRRTLRDILNGTSDVERIAVRVGSGHAGPRDLLAVKLSLHNVRRAKEQLSTELKGGARPALLESILNRMNEETALAELISRAISDDPPVQLDQGGVIRAGYDAALDEKRTAAHEGKTWLQELESRERQATGISSLKVGYTSVFGYYLEVTKPHLSKVPPAWHRKQTLVNNERFVNDDLKKLEDKILGAEEQALRIERALFQNLVTEVKERAESLQQTAKALAELDCFLSLAETAEAKGLAKPLFEPADRLMIVNGWHPVVKDALPAGAFVSNDTLLDAKDCRIVILTGPNMAGKSTFLRQTALIALMAQIGSFVSAQEARLGVVDRIFTRIGSGDRLSQGESTFMVEMRETARILANATSRSLVILDEVGRGTSTYDGLSIAWSILEHLAKTAKPKTLFATHYFELTSLAGELDGVKNFNVQAKEWKDTVVFLHKIAPGAADRSYGIHVAQLAGLPEDVIARAKKILDKLEREHQSVLQSNRSRQRELELDH